MSRSGRAQQLAARALACGALLLAAAAPRAAFAQANEQGLWELWQRHIQPETATNHEALLESCRGFSQANRADPLAAVSETLAAWHLLHLGRREEAAAIYSRYTGERSEPLPRGAAQVAQAWLTRLDREQVKVALQFYYRREVGYPPSLKELAAYKPLPKEQAPPFRDRWDAEWSYRLVGLKRIPGLLDQKYELLSKRLGTGSDLAEALKVPCGDKIRIRPLAVRSAEPGREIIEMGAAPPPEGSAPPKSAAAPASATVLVSAGQSSSGVLLAYVGRHLLVLCDDYSWKVLPRPDNR